MKKLFGLIIMIVGVVLPGSRGNHIEDEHARKEGFNKFDKKQNLTPEEEQKEIRKKLKGLGYFQ